MNEGEKIINVNIEEEMKSSYIDYSMSVIVSRALPDVRDGFKPVHRRVLFGMHDLGVRANSSYKKSARIVGEVLGKYHPHGDSSVYFTMVRMAQHWSLRYPLVEGQGNFGSVDGDPPAAMRYTEARLHKIADETLIDIEKETVDFQYNFDDTLFEPTVLPTRIPNLLINGTSGIAVGMATNMAPHNLTDSIKAIVAYIENNDIEIEELTTIIKAPDFPTGGIIYGYQGVKDAYLTGQGRIVMRAKSTIETEPSGREKIIVNEIPYLVNKAELIKKTADLVIDKKIEGISEVNDESDKDGMRIVYTLKRDAIANVILNKLFKFTALQSSFSINSIALVKGRPKMLNLKDIIRHFVEHRHDVVVRRTQYELQKAKDRAHVLEGLIIASDNIDEVIAIIRGAESQNNAKERLVERFKFSEIQVNAIIQMRLGQLTKLDQNKLRNEYEEIMALIKKFEEILADEDLRMKIITDELLEISHKYGDERRSEIIQSAEEFNPEDFYADEEMVITISHLGYIKRTPLSEYKLQNRGGVGSRGSNSRDEDFIEHLFIATMHNTMLFFTKNGKCFWLKVYDIPEGTKISKGRAIQNLLNIEPGDSVKTFINAISLTDEEYINNNYIVLCTTNGIIKKTVLEAYSRPRQNGVNAVTIREGDELLNAVMTNGENDILMAVKSGKAIRFPEAKIRAMGRTAAGVKGITLSKGDHVIGLVCLEPEENKTILVVSENGYGKRSLLDSYRITNRGGKGVKTINVTEKTGSLVALKAVNENDDLIIINQSGLTIRIEVSTLRVMGRTAQGVRLINLRNDDIIASVCPIPVSDADHELRLLEKNGEESDSVEEDSTEDIGNIEEKSSGEIDEIDKNEE
ncbi:MAG: DNA gyrase subunit A [Bacteroidales bacterium]|jgi:DNA gyrase subunit A|nr:DNA gyrase subunit A [Bacteroidales bacterium]